MRESPRQAHSYVHNKPHWGAVANQNSRNSFLVFRHVGDNGERSWRAGSVSDRSTPTNPMPIPHVAVLIETTRAYGRGLLEGVAEYVRAHGPWSIDFTPRGLGE